MFWRGSTTGSKDITPDNLERNLRYQLCRHSLFEPAHLDARFNRVVQCLNDKNATAVRLQLRQKGLIGPTVGPWHASLHAWLIDIDGNVNSWGLLWKLLSGCCVLRVMSNRQQWFSQTHDSLDTYGPDCPRPERLTKIKFTGASTTANAVNLLQQQVNNWGTDYCRPKSRSLCSHRAVPTFAERMNWSPNDWMNHGGSLLASDPVLAQRLIGKGITLEPEQAIGWFNLGIGLHQQRKISAAIKAYKHCLGLPHSTDTGIAARNNLSQDLLLQGDWVEGWTLYNQRFKRKPGNYPIFS